MIGIMTPEQIEALPRDYSKRVKDRIAATEFAGQVNSAQNAAGNFIFSKAIPVGLSIAGLGPIASMVNTLGWIPTATSVAGSTIGGYALGKGSYYLADLYDQKHGTNYAPLAGFVGSLAGGFGGGYAGYKGTVQLGSRG
jgi:hypothetical protein